MWPARIIPRSVALLLSLFVALTLLTLRPKSLRPLPSALVLINEIDASTPGTDTAEFVELYDGGTGLTSLDGLVLVFFNGQDDRSYRALDLNGLQTGSTGYFLIGNESVPGVDLTFADNVLQDGPDAVALYVGEAANFPNGTAVTSHSLQDAVVYDSGDPDDPGLLALLLPGEPQVDEDSLTLADFHSSQRCPNGSGGARQTGSYVQDLPTPKGPNRCPTPSDMPPSVVSTSPAAAGTGVLADAAISVTFSEPVALAGSWYDIACTLSGNHLAAVAGDGVTFVLDPASDFAYGETCSVTLFANAITDLDPQDPPDHMDADFGWSFTIVEAVVAGGILINEIDTDTAGSDTAEFIELYDGGHGSTRLDGLVLVFFNGSSDTSYRAVDLDGQTTSPAGYLLVGSAGLGSSDLIIPDGVLQNGPDAVALYEGSSGDFPSGTAVTTSSLRDAIVYDTDDADDSGLLSLLKAGQPQVNEANRAQPERDSNQRCPNGTGAGRETAAYLQNLPTPGSANKCTFDAPPRVVETWPAAGQTNVAQTAVLSLRFSEPVGIEAQDLVLTCTSSAAHAVNLSGGPSQFTASPRDPFSAGETCTAAIAADAVSDLDQDDPPDHMDHNYSWSFSIKALPVATHMLINEVDADTPGTDTAEFIELFDGGSGGTRLDGLVLVLYNGSDDLSYRAVDLDGYVTNGAGYFLAGGSEVPGADLLLANGLIQNGADAVALYAANSADFAAGSPVSLSGLLDALVYDTDDEDDPGLLVLLQSGQPQINEASRGSKELDSSQRCPNGTGGQRISNGFLQNPPTPGTTNNCVEDTPPQVVETTPANGAADVPIDSNLAIRFSEDVALGQDWFEISCTQSLTHAAVQSGGPRSFGLDPQADFQNGEHCSVTLFSGEISDLDGLAQFLSSDYTWSFNTGAPPFGACGAAATPLHALQGSGLSSPLRGAQDVVVEGIVAGDFQGGGELQGFFLQSLEGAQDDDPLTSEGLFINAPEADLNVAIGDIVRAQGSVDEVDGLTTLNTLVNLVRCGSASLPVPVELMLPLPDLAVWEQVEGMRVALPQTLSVTGSDDLVSAGLLDLSVGTRLYAPTEVTLPGEPALAVAALNSRSRIKLDDGSNLQPPSALPPYLAADGTVRIGDRVSGVVGILSESAAAYRIYPTEAVTITRSNQRPVPPDRDEQSLRVALFDTSGYFNGDGQGAGFPGPIGAASAAEFARQRGKIIAALLEMDLDIVALVALENDGFDANSALQDLVDGLNDAADAGAHFAFVNPQRPKIGDGKTALGLIYRDDKVRPLGQTIILEAAPFGTAVPVPILQRFAATGREDPFVLAVASFPGREACPPAGHPNADQGDGQGCWNANRIVAAAALVDFLEANFTHGALQEDILLLGNFQAFLHEDPLATFSGAGFVNLTASEPGHTYTSVIGGQTGALLHALASPPMALRVLTTELWHINADEPPALDYRMTNPAPLFAMSPYRSAEHDPILVDVCLDFALCGTKEIHLPVVLAD